MLEPINGEHERDIFFGKGNRVRDQSGKQDFDGSICLGLRMYNKSIKRIRWGQNTLPDMPLVQFAEPGT